MERLTSLDKNEFFDVYRQFRPNTSREEFERDWLDFQTAKAAHEASLGIQ